MACGRSVLGACGVCAHFTYVRHGRCLVVFMCLLWMRFVRGRGFLPACPLPVGRSLRYSHWTPAASRGPRSAVRGEPRDDSVDVRVRLRPMRRRVRLRSQTERIGQGDGRESRAGLQPAPLSLLELADALRRSHARASHVPRARCALLLTPKPTAGEAHARKTGASLRPAKPAKQPGPICCVSIPVFGTLARIASDLAPTTEEGSLDQIVKGVVEMLPTRGTA